MESTLSNLDAASLAFLATFGGDAGVKALEDAGIKPLDVSIADFKTVLAQETALDQGIIPTSEQISHGISISDMTGVPSSWDIIEAHPELQYIAPKTMEYVHPIATDIERVVAATKSSESIPARLDGTYGVYGQDVPLSYFQAQERGIESPKPLMAIKPHLWGVVGVIIVAAVVMMFAKGR